ncbi:MAG: hypothetical protein WCI51_21865 [Lentisphaerota bacterium]
MAKTGHKDFSVHHIPDASFWVLRPDFHALPEIRRPKPGVDTRNEVLNQAE